LSENPEREEILYTKISLILFTLCTVGFILFFVVFMETFGYRHCSKYTEDHEDENKVVDAADEDGDGKDGPMMLEDDVIDDDAPPQAVDNDEPHDQELDAQQPQEDQETNEQEKETNDKETTDSDDPYAVVKPPKNTGDGTDGTEDTGDEGETGEEVTGGDTLETDGVDGTGDTTNSDLDAGLLNVEETNDDTLDKDLDAALVASAASAASDVTDKNGEAAKIANGEAHPDLDAALAASAEEALIQASAEDIELDDMMKKQKN